MDTVGSLRSILKSALLMPVFVLPAWSEHDPDATWTALPSAEPVLTDFGKAAAQVASRPDPESPAEKALLTAVTYQPFRPFGAAGVGPLSVIVGAGRAILKSGQ